MESKTQVKPVRKLPPTMVGRMCHVVGMSPGGKQSFNFFGRVTQETTSGFYVVDLTDKPPVGFLGEWFPKSSRWCLCRVQAN